MALFARHGYAGTSVRQIAEVSGLTKAGLYYHFADKAALYRAAIGETSRYLEGRVTRSVCDIAEPALRVRAFLHAQARTFVEEGHLLRLFYNNLFLGSEDRPSLGDDIAYHECTLLQLLQDCSADGLLEANRVQIVSTLLSGGLEIVGATWLIDPRQPAPTSELADRVLLVAAPRIAEAAGIDASTAFPEKGSHL
jgi:AcrR family transcriptional regulator